MICSENIQHRFTFIHLKHGHKVYFCLFLKTRCYDRQNLYRQTLTLYRHQRVHRGVGRDCAHFAAGGEISRHRAASHQCVGIVSGCECGNGAEERGDALGGGHQRCGGYDLHEVIGEQRFGERHGVFRARCQCRHGSGECAEPCDSGTRSVARRGAANGWWQSAWLLLSC